MNFFQAQDDARRRTLFLVGLFSLAVVCLIVLTNLLVGVVAVYSNSYAALGPASTRELLSAVPATTWIGVSLAVAATVAAASGFKYLMIRRGGRAIAEALGGRPLTHDGASSREKRLLNVVEEMAIASGIPVPPLYVIPEPSINAFAAGFSVHDAVIGVNEGTLTYLDRDELQGVIAHEFSHIFNGDMLLNLRLIAMLHGILFIGIVGHVLLRGGSRRRGDSGNSGALPLLALGGGLVAIGYSGTFFGNLIKAGVSRQREYLADAAAVQYTRNPHGIADALKKIGGLELGSTMTTPRAREVSHLFFGAANRRMLRGWMSTHPPLGDRIRAVDPGWDGRFTRVAGASPAPAAPTADAAPPVEGMSSLADVMDVRDVPGPDIDATIGHPSPASVHAAAAVIAEIGPALGNAAHDPFAARAVVYGMLLDRDAAIRERQLGHLLAQADPGVYPQTQALHGSVAVLSAHEKLALFEMAVPALKTLSDAQYRRFADNVVSLIKLDNQIGLLEWVLHRMMMNSLRPHFDGPVRVPIKHRSVDAVVDHARGLLATLAAHGHPHDPAAAATAFGAGAAVIGADPSGYIAPRTDDFSGLNENLRHLRGLAPLAKPRILKACAATALHDGTVSADEYALLQGVAATLDCPLPPLESICE